MFLTAILGTSDSGHSTDELYTPNYAPPPDKRTLEFNTKKTHWLNDTPQSSSKVGSLRTWSYPHTTRTLSSRTVPTILPLVNVHKIL